MTHPRPLTEERDALRYVLSRLMAEETNLDNLCKHVPRVVSVAANVARIQSILESSAGNDATDELVKLLAELNEEMRNEEVAAFN